jgi:DnaK suppressor protein
LLESAVNTQEKLSEQQGDVESRVKAGTQATVDETVLAQVKDELKQLRNNLEWLNHEHGGECEECGSSIPLARLLAVPTTRLCLNCAGLHENND